MRYEMIEVIAGSGIRVVVAYVECWRCGEDTLEWDLSQRGLCEPCLELCGDIGYSDDEAEW